ncbi:MAG: DNA-directed RNA polymerase specialized sigma subunit, partial [Myxococcota bacterium]
MSQVEVTRVAAAHRAYAEGHTASGKGISALVAKAKKPVSTEAARETRNDLVRKHASLVLRIARKVRRRTGYAVELDDLVCEGTIGLLQAAERFDPDRETDFEHLASVRVHGAMLDALRRLDPLSQRRRREAR